MSKKRNTSLKGIFTWQHIFRHCSAHLQLTPTDLVQSNLPYNQTSFQWYLKIHQSISLFLHNYFPPDCELHGVIYEFLTILPVMVPSSRNVQPLLIFLFDTVLCFWGALSFWDLCYFWFNLCTTLLKKSIRPYYYFLEKPGGFQWSVLAWGDLEPSYASRLSIVSVDGKQRLCEVVLALSSIFYCKENVETI